MDASPALGSEPLSPPQTLWKNTGQNGAGGEMSGPLSVPRPVSALLGSSAISRGGGGGSRATGEPCGHSLERAGSHARSFWKLQRENSRARSLCPSLSLVHLAPATFSLSLGRISLFSFSARPHSVRLSCFLSRQSVFSLFFGIILLLCLFVLLSLIPQTDPLLPFFILSPFSSPFSPHLLTGCLLFLSLHCLWSWVSRLLSPLPTPAMTRQCPPP